MKYNFKDIKNRRNSGSVKYMQMKESNPNVGENIVPFTVADLDFETAPEIRSALKDFVENNPFGYTIATDSYYDSVISWMDRRHSFKVLKEWIIPTDGVLTAIDIGIKTLTEKEDGVIVFTPVYPHFYRLIESNHRKIVRSKLKVENNSYSIDYLDFEEKCSQKENKLLILCSPHNPVGRVWSKKELKKLTSITKKHGVKIISDEIHFDIIMDKNEHTVLFNVDEDIKDDVILCTAPSKSFNLASLKLANTIIPSEEIRTKFQEKAEEGQIFPNNAIGYKACEISYNKSEDWIDELNLLVYSNHNFIKEYLEKNIPEIKTFDLEGTYLQWLDFSGLGLSEEALNELLNKKAQVFLNDGIMFGKEGKLFKRMNIAYPRKYIEEALKRLEAAIREREKNFG